MNPLASIKPTSALAKFIVAGFFLVLFAGLQFTLMSHHHTDDAHPSQEHSIKQQCEICLYVFSKQYQFVEPAGLQIPEAAVLALTKSQFEIILEDVQQVHSQLVNRGPPII